MMEYEKHKKTSSLDSEDLLPHHAPGFLLNPLCANPKRCESLCWNNLITHPRSIAVDAIHFT